MRCRVARTLPRQCQTAEPVSTEPGMLMMNFSIEVVVPFLVRFNPVIGKTAMASEAALVS
jgi:hypothetical protein